MGNVYLARRVGAAGFEKPVRVWQADWGTRPDAGFLDAVISEAKRAAPLSHANIAHVLDLGVLDHGCFVVTELVSGATLGGVLQKAETLPWPAVTRIAREAARALRYAHTRRAPSGQFVRLIHGRLSPGRIVIGESDGVKVTGFGTSRAWRPRDPYRAPELDRREPVDGRADVFSLGMILKRCLGRDAGPSALRRAITRATEPYQEHRFTACELEEELTDILHGATVLRAQASP